MIGKTIAKAILLFIICSVAYAQSSFLSAVPTTLDSGITNTFYVITANHFAFVFNNSTVQAQYVLTFELCVPQNPCYMHSMIVHTQANQGVNIYWTSSLNALFTTANTYTITATTMLLGLNTNLTVIGTAPANIINPM